MHSHQVQVVSGSANTGVSGHAPPQIQGSTERVDKSMKMEIDGGNAQEDEKGESAAPPLPTLTLNTLVNENSQSSNAGTNSQDVYMDVSG